MGAGESKQTEGIVTVSSGRPHGAGSSGGSGSAPTEVDTLLAHLLALRALVPNIEGRVAGADPSSVWRDIESAKQLGADTRELSEAAAALLGAYRDWHAERARAAVTNQDYIHRCIDQAEAKAAKALRHLRLQLQRIRGLNAALSDAAALPELLAQASRQTAALQAQCDELTGAADAAAAAAAAAERG